MKTRLFLPLCVMIASSAAWGSQGSNPPFAFRKFCDTNGENCADAPTDSMALEALAQLRAHGVKYEKDGVGHAWIAAAGATAGALTWAGSAAARSSYLESVETAASAGKVARDQMLKIRGAISRAFAPLVQEVGEKVVAENAERAARNKLALNADQIKDLFHEALNKFTNETEIKRALRPILKGETDAIYAAAKADEGLYALFQGLKESSSMLKAGGKIARQGGLAVAEKFAKLVSTSVAGKMLRQGAKAVAAEVGGGMLSQCVKGLGKLGAKAGTGALGGVVGVAVVMTVEIADWATSAEKVSSDTPADWFARHPDGLLELPPAEAEKFIKEDPRIASGIVQVRDVALKMGAEGGEKLAQASACAVSASDATGSLNNAMAHCPSDDTP